MTTNVELAEMRKLDPNAKKAWLIGRGIFFLILLGAYVAGWFFLKDGMKDGGWIYLAVGGAVLLFQLLNMLVYPAIEYRQWAYHMDEDKILLQHGIYFQKTSLIPIIRIQHVEIKAGPINRMFSLADLDIKTAGGSASIPCLSKEEATLIAEYLNGKTIAKLKEKQRQEEGKKDGIADAVGAISVDGERNE